MTALGAVLVLGTLAGCASDGTPVAELCEAPRAVLAQIWQTDAITATPSHTDREGLKIAGSCDLRTDFGPQAFVSLRAVPYPDDASADATERRFDVNDVTVRYGGSPSVPHFAANRDGWETTLWLTLEQSVEDALRADQRAPSAQVTRLSEQQLAQVTQVVADVTDRRFG